jgi:hypothetical protein
MGFALLGRVPFVNRHKRYQKRLPLHPALRCAPGSRAESPLQRHVVKGNPWPFTTLAASMPLNLLHGNPAHPPDGAVRSVYTSYISTAKTAPHDLVKTQTKARISGLSSIQSDFKKVLTVMLQLSDGLTDIIQRLMGALLLEGFLHLRCPHPRQNLQCGNIQITVVEV